MNSSGEKSSWNTRLLHTLRELDFLPTEFGDDATADAAGKGNTLFALSGMCYFFLYYRRGGGNTAAWFAMVLGLFFLTQLAPAIHRQIRLPRIGKLLALLSAVGIMGAGVRLSMDYLSLSNGTVQLAALLGMSAKLAAAGISGVFGLCGVWFLYGFTARLYTALLPIIRHLFSGTGRGERWALAALLLALAVFTALVFSRSQAFYATEHNYDVIYTADSHYLAMGNTWMNLTFVENDLRQPLFAVFAAPFVGISYILTQFVPSGSWLGPWLMNLPQLGLMLLGFYMLAALLGKGASGRLAVTVSLCALYPSLLFSLMMEQYMVAVFWLLLFVYMAVEKLPGRGAVLVAAAGSLLTSAAMLPTLWEKNEPRPVRRALAQSLTAAVLGAFLIVVFFRLDVILNLTKSVEQLSTFAGESVPFIGRARQYLVFVAGCFIAPPAGVSTPLGYPSWQLLPVERWILDGVAVWIIGLWGFVLGRRDRLVQISAWWCLFSVLLLVGFGWGTAENGLILYGLYFSWAFYVLFRRGLNCPARRQTVLDWVLALVLLALNVPGMRELLHFAVSYYPV